MIFIPSKIKGLSSLVIIIFILFGLISPFGNISKAQQNNNLPGDIVNSAIVCSGVIEKLTGFLRTLIPATDVPVAENVQRKKEGCLDHIAFLVANRIIEEVAKDTINWINGTSGDGGPRYVKDLGGFLEDLGDRVVGEYIQGTNFGFVCDPFKVQIKASLAKLRSKPQQRSECTLSEAIDNVDAFIDGNFREGGWKAWTELTTRSNPYLQFLEAKNEISVRIAGRQSVELAKLQWGNGFFGWEVCPGQRYMCQINGKDEPWPATAGATGCDAQGGVYHCAVPLQTATPGSVIEEQLNKVLSSGQARLEVADEINEVLSALLTKLINDIMGNNGLAGYQPRAGTTFGADALCVNYGICGEDGPEGEYTSCVERCNSLNCTEPRGPNNENPPECNVSELQQCLNSCRQTNSDGSYVRHTNYDAQKTVIIEAGVPQLLSTSRITIRVDGTDKFSCTYTPCSYSNVYADGDYTYDASYTLDGELQKIGEGSFKMPQPAVSTTTPTNPGNPADTLRTERGRYGATISLAEAGEILNKVAWAHRSGGWGLSRKENGSKCPSRVGNIACDVLYHQPTNTLYDVFEAGPNDSSPRAPARPVFNRIGPNTDRSRPWVAPAQP
jgi:hypothetical protein